MDTKNLAVVRQSFANTVFTHKVQEIAVEKQEQMSFFVKVINVFFVSLVLLLLFLQTKYPGNMIFSYMGVGVTISEIIFLVVQLTFNFDQKSLAHKNAALKFLELRDQYRLLITDIMTDNINRKELLVKRNALQDVYQTICDLAPQTSQNEYSEAQKRLNKRGVVEGEEFTWSDEEIDRFLPEELKIRGKK